MVFEPTREYSAKSEQQVIRYRLRETAALSLRTDVPLLAPALLRHQRRRFRAVYRHTPASVDRTNWMPPILPAYDLRTLRRQGYGSSRSDELVDPPDELVFGRGLSDSARHQVSFSRKRGTKARVR